MDSTDRPHESSVSLKRPYTKPTLVIYGPLKALARSSAGSTSDFFISSGAHADGPDNKKNAPPKPSPSD
jgi:hypothetical protein